MEVEGELVEGCEDFVVNDFFEEVVLDVWWDYRRFGGGEVVE